MLIRITADVDVPDDSAYVAQAQQRGYIWESLALTDLADSVTTDCLDGLDLLGVLKVVKVSIAPEEGTRYLLRGGGALREAEARIRRTGIGPDGKTGDVDFDNLVELVDDTLHARGLGYVPPNIDANRFMEAIQKRTPSAYLTDQKDEASGINGIIRMR
jgi:hypothetical protein